MKLTAARRVLLRNLGAHLTGIYGSKALDFLVLASVTRLVPMEMVGTVFLAEAIGGAVFRFVDLGLFPVLFRRAARAQLGPRVLGAATGIRLAGLAALTLGFLAITMVHFPEKAFIAAPFFFFSGVYVVHEIPRAVLAGRERFALIASTGVVSKVVELGTTVVGLYLGYGIASWILGRALSQLGMLAGCYAFAHRSVRGFPNLPIGAALREGLPFWFASAINSAVFRLDTILVGATIGLVETAYFGVAGRIIGAGLSVVSSLMNVSFPTLARERAKHFTRTQLVVIVTIAFGLAGGAYLVAPLAVWIVMGEANADAVLVLRALTPVIALSAFARALTTWLQAKNRERGIAVSTMAAGIASIAALVLLVPTLGTTGAALARVARNAMAVSFLGGVAYVTIRRVLAPGVWLMSKIPGVAGVLRRRHPAEVQELGAKFADVPGVAQVEMFGSAIRPETFRLGSSDFDVLVTVEGRGLAVAEAARRCRRVARQGSLLGPVSVSVVQPEALVLARELGTPVFAAEARATLRGSPIEPSVQQGSARAWATTHAFMMLARLQRTVVEEARPDGSVRVDRVAKDFRFLLLRLAEPGEDPHQVLQRLGSDDSILQASPHVWLDPSQTVGLLEVSGKLLAARCEALGASWAPAGDQPESPPRWIEEVAETADERVRSLVRAAEPIAVELMPTGPTDDDPMLLITAEGWSVERWLAWRRQAAESGPLPLPFRAFPWPLVVPPAVARADVLLEHTVLLHTARRFGTKTLFGRSVSASEPDPTFLRGAILREVAVALLRIPVDAAMLLDLDEWRPSALPEPRELGHHWKFRVRAYTTGRLAALSLAQDHGMHPRDGQSAADAYVERYDDGLSRLMREKPEETSGRRVAEVLCEWVDGRLARLEDGRSGA